MRNLKKFLALVMAMVMAFSLMITANAAEIRPSTNFSDDDAITETFVKAVDVLGGMKVFQGDENGFRPGSTITRAEVAALIYRLATGDVENVRNGLYANYGNFADVNEGDWYAGYVGYCANAGYIKGTSPTTFNPYAPVTGYEALAMILRVVGYDKNHEFEGPTWQTRVSALATSLGILDDVKTTDYANTLHLASRRDVVASLLFNAVKPVSVDGPAMVTYSPALGYQTTNLDGVTPNSISVGTHIFGLTATTGVIVGNQESGLTVTRLSTEKGADNDFNFDWVPVKPSGAAKTAFSLDMETGLLEFGHKFEVWHNNASTAKVYAAYDKVAKTQLAYVDGNDQNGVGADLDTTYAATPATLGQVAQRYGFSVPSTGAYWSDSFKRIYESGTPVAPTEDDEAGSWANTNGLYLLISNSGTTLDLVISVNAEGTRITRLNNMTSTKTIQMPFVDADTSYVPDNGNIPTNVVVDSSYTARTDMTGASNVNVNQATLTKNSSTTLGDYVISTAIGLSDDNASDHSISGYNTHSIVANTKVGQVVNYKTGATSAYDRNFNRDYVQLSDGTKIEKSQFYYTVPGTSQNAANEDNEQLGDAIIPQVYNDLDGAGKSEKYTNGSYRFYLDEHGDYVGAEPVMGEEFLYGTYADYSQETSTSTFKYYMTGVTLKGEVVTREFSTLNGGRMTGNNLAHLGTYYHSFQNQVNTERTGLGSIADTTVTPNRARYNGFMITSSNGLYDERAVSTLKPSDRGIFQLAVGDASGLTISQSDLLVGAVQAATAAINSTTADTPVYLTENTQFYVVSGQGTDNVKVNAYKGISDLLGGAYSLTITRSNTTPAQFITDDASTNMCLSDAYYTLADGYYAAVDNRVAREIDTIILNANDIGREGSLYFTGRATPELVDQANANYKQFTLYLGAEAQKVWIDTSLTPVNPNMFYSSLGTVGTSYTGEPVYRLGTNYVQTGSTLGSFTLVDGTQGAAYASGTGANGTGLQYTARSRDAQTATILTSTAGVNNNLFNVANAKVVNLIPGLLPGVVDLATLNEAGSDPGLYGNVYVYIVTTTAGGAVVDTIYVTGVQN